MTAMTGLPPEVVRHILLLKGKTLADLPLELIEQDLIFETRPFSAEIVSIVDEGVEREFGHGGQ